MMSNLIIRRNKMENLKANKKLLICICVLVVIAIVAIVFFVVNKSAYKKQIKDFAAAMEDSEKMEKFVDENVNYRAWYALSKLEEDENLDMEDEKAVKKAFEKAYKDAKKSDYESDEVKDNAKMLFGLLTMYTSRSGDDVKVEVKDIGKLKEGEDFKFLQQAEFKMKITAGEDSTESEWRALFYKGKMVMVGPVDDNSSDDFNEDDYNYDYDFDTEYDWEYDEEE